jgi:hypothetical protein
VKKPWTSGPGTSPGVRQARGNASCSAIIELKLAVVFGPVDLWATRLRCPHIHRLARAPRTRMVEGAAEPQPKSGQRVRALVISIPGAEVSASVRAYLARRPQKREYSRGSQII